MSFENPDFFKRVDEDKKYVSPVDGGETDGGKVNKPNGKLDNNLDAKNPEKKFESTKRVIDTVNTKEASEKRTDHPTPDEILAQLNSSFLGSAEKPKNSIEGGVQIVEGSVGRLETPTAS